MPNLTTDAGRRTTQALGDLAKGMALAQASGNLFAIGQLKDSGGPLTRWWSESAASPENVIDELTIPAK
jgi:hypothetical protein